MSPSKFEDSEVTKGALMINGSRPSPLRINKESHAIQKPSSSSFQSVVENSSGNVLSSKNQTKRQPVIIYTHSPKIIHAQARDFMSLVQKLTGFSRSEEDEKISEKFDLEMKEEKDEKYAGEYKQDSSVVSPMSKVANPYLADVPLFSNPNYSNESFLCSSKSNSLFQSPSLGNPISPSFMDYMKGLPEF